MENSIERNPLSVELGLAPPQSIDLLYRFNRIYTSTLWGFAPTLAAQSTVSFGRGEQHA